MNTEITRLSRDRHHFLYRRFKKLTVFWTIAVDYRSAYCSALVMENFKVKMLTKTEKGLAAFFDTYLN